MRLSQQQFLPGPNTKVFPSVRSRGSEPHTCQFCIPTLLCCAAVLRRGSFQSAFSPPSQGYNVSMQWPGCLFCSLDYVPPLGSMNPFRICLEGTGAAPMHFCDEDQGSLPHLVPYPMGLCCRTGCCSSSAILLMQDLL